jgi:hypothetical protein
MDNQQRIARDNTAIAAIMIVLAWLGAGGGNTLRERENIARLMVPWAFYLVIRHNVGFAGRQRGRLIHSQDLSESQIQSLRRMSGIADRSMPVGYVNRLGIYYGPGFFPGFYTSRFAGRIRDLYTAITGGSAITTAGLESPADYETLRALYAALVLIAAGFVVRSRPFR